MPAVLPRLRSLARRFLLVTLVVIGALCGVLAVAFHKFVELAYGALAGHALMRHGIQRIAMIIVTPAIVFALIAWAIRRFAPRAVGANLARVRMAYNENPGLLGWRSILATFIATPLSLGAGAPLGPEGPIVVITSGVSAAIGRMLGLPRKLVRGMIPVGVAAGIAAIFNAPITGVVFALEEVVGTADRELLGGVLIGAVAAAVVERFLLGGRALLAAPASTWHDGRELIGFALVGVVAGLVSGTSIAFAHRLKRAFARAMPSMVRRAMLAGLLVGGAGLIAPSVLGVGYESVTRWLHGGGTIRETAIAFAVKSIIFVVAITGGILGGSFAPSLFIGTALGAAVGLTARDLFPHAKIDPQAYALIGMGSFFAGLLRSPIAAVLIVIEVTRDYDLVLPLMLGVSIAVAVSRRISPLSVVEQQMIDEGYVEGHDVSDPLHGITVAEAMTPDPLVVQEGANVPADFKHHFFPVVDAEGRLAGVLRRGAGQPETLVREVMEQPALVAHADDEVIDVVARMRIAGVDRCPVIDRATRRVVGFLSPSDILRARMNNVGRVL